jgi:hypothetical protein
MLSTGIAIASSFRNLEKFLDIHGFSMGMGELLSGQEDTPWFETVMPRTTDLELTDPTSRHRRALLNLIGLSYRARSQDLAFHLTETTVDQLTPAFKYGILDLPLKLSNEMRLDSFMASVSADPSKLAVLVSTGRVSRRKRIEKARITKSSQVQKLQELDFSIKADYVEVSDPVDFLVSIKEYKFTVRSPLLNPQILLKISMLNIDLDQIDRVIAMKELFMASPESQKGKFPQVHLYEYRYNPENSESVSRIVDKIYRFNIFNPTPNINQNSAIFRDVYEVNFSVSETIDLSSIQFLKLFKLKISNTSQSGYRSLLNLQASINRVEFYSNEFTVTFIPHGFKDISFDSGSKFSMANFTFIDSLSISCSVESPNLQNFMVHEYLDISRHPGSVLATYKLHMTGPRVKIYLVFADLKYIVYSSTVRHIEIDKFGSPDGYYEHLKDLPSHIRGVTISSGLIRGNDLLEILSEKLDTIEIYVFDADKETMMNKEIPGFKKSVVDQKIGNLTISFIRILD